MNSTVILSDISNGNGATRGCVNGDRIVIFGWTMPLNLHLNRSRVWSDVSWVIWHHTFPWGINPKSCRGLITDPVTPPYVRFSCHYRIANLRANERCLCMIVLLQWHQIALIKSYTFQIVMHIEKYCKSVVLHPICPLCPKSTFSFEKKT